MQLDTVSMNESVVEWKDQSKRKVRYIRMLRICALCISKPVYHSAIMQAKTRRPRLLNIITITMTKARLLAMPSTQSSQQVDHPVRVVPINDHCSFNYISFGKQGLDILV